MRLLPALIVTMAMTVSAAEPQLSQEQRDYISFEALSRLHGADVAKNPALQTALDKLLEKTRSMPHFVQIVKEFHIKNRDNDLLKIALAHPASDDGVEAIRLILANGNLDLLRRTLQSADAIRIVEALGYAAEKQTVPLLLPMVSDVTRDLALRKQTIHALAQTSEGATQLLKLSWPDDLKYTASMELNSVRWPELKAEAAKLLPLPAAQNSQPLPPTAELLLMKANAATGEKIFYRDPPGCFNCHRIHGRGGQIGPDLSEIGVKLGKDALIEAILFPSAGIAPGYEAWTMELKSGDEAYGLLASDSADDIAIKDLKGIVTHYKKNDIVSRRQLKTSLMPDGLQKAMTTQEFVDLIEFLASRKKAEN